MYFSHNKSNNKLVESSDLKEKNHKDAIRSIEFSFGSEYLASGGDDKEVLVWDCKSWKLVGTK